MRSSPGDMRGDTFVSAPPRPDGLQPVTPTRGRDTRDVFRVSLRPRKRLFAGTFDAGGGTRTPDTRIMIPLRLGSAAAFAGAGGHKRGHIRRRSGRPRAGVAAPRRIARASGER